MTVSKDLYLKNTWEKICDYLSTNQKIEPEMVAAFYRTAELYELNDKKAIIVVPNIITRQIILPSVDLINGAFLDLNYINSDISIELLLKSELSKVDDVQDKTSTLNPYEDEFASMPLQEDRTFENFVVGDCNRESQAAALACAIMPGKKFNPLFIYGNSGLGKTHLLMAIGNYVHKAYPNKKIYYIEALKFVDMVVHSIQNNRIDYLKKFMYEIDVFLVDDIQFLAGKEKSHEIFFSIYNELKNNGKQICIASDRQPKEIKGLEDRLISRFSSGLSVGIDSPEFETSLAILRRKISDSGNDITDVEEEGLAYIASNFSGNIRDLEGAWNRVLFYAIMFQEDKEIIHFETVVKALKGQVVVNETTGLSPNKIIKAVADYYNIDKQQITGKTRTKTVANARHIAIYLCRKDLDLSYSKIGESFGGRDHSTVMSACIKVEEEMKKDERFSIVIKDIEKQLGT